MVLVDTNVLIDVVQEDPIWGGWSEQQLRSQSKVHELAINPVIYAEFSISFSTPERLDSVVDQLRLSFREVPRSALFLAGKAFARYRRAGGARTTVLPDFFIGAHAVVSEMSLLTRDPRRYAAYFPSIELISPQQ